jgi:ABC-type amino acid transport substrate-binding protein
MSRKNFIAWLCACLLLAACIPPEADIQDVVAHDPGTTMARLQRKGEIVIALPDDLGPFSSVDDDGEPRGFVGELATEVVAALGVKATYVAAPGEEGLDMVRNGEVDLAFPAVGITEQLARRNNLSAPYWVAHKRLLVPEDSPVQTAEDLDGDVCQYEEERTRTNIAELVDGIQVTDVADFRQCPDALQRGAEAATSPDIYLMVLADELDGYEIRGEQLSTAGYGAALPPESSDMTGWVNAVLTDTKSDGRWRTYYEEWLAPVANTPGVNAPDLTLEEAATLWPTGLSE